jgi:hypothetical protein
LLRASPAENTNLYYGVAGSYGSLGALVSAEIQLVPIQDFIYLRYHCFSDPLKAIETMKELIHSSNKPDFIDGIIFAKNLAVIMEGSLQPEDDNSRHAPLFSLQHPSSQWFYQHVKTVAIQMPTKSYVEKMTPEDYFFRYDLGAFWMGTYLFSLSFLTRFVFQGIMGSKKKDNFTESEIQHFHQIPNPPTWGRMLFYPFLKAQTLWAFLHKAENWIQNRMVIQDFCIPESKAIHFCKEILHDPAIFPIWLCPIKGTRDPQIFSPHLLTKNQRDSYVINFGIYGIPSYAKPIRQITKKLEQRAYADGGRKALYSHSYYTEEEFWQIYSRSSYEDLRHKTQANGIWHEITDKVLSQ